MALVKAAPCLSKLLLMGALGAEENLLASNRQIHSGGGFSGVNDDEKNDTVVIL